MTRIGQSVELPHGVLFRGQKLRTVALTVENDDIARIIHVGRTKVAQVVAGASQTHQMLPCILLTGLLQDATEVPALAAFARSGLLIRE